jgi:8-oxo-dGTP pyrophosphatase MutT (NUDIX family)
MLLPTSAGTITFNIRTRQVLLIKVKSPGSGEIYWTIPKGEIEKGEDPKEAAIRETYEETGIKPIIIRKVETIEIYRQWRGTKFHKLVHIFAAYTTDSNPKPGDEVLDAKFVDFDKALIALKKHDSDYISALMKSLWIIYKKFPSVYEID